MFDGVCVCLVVCLCVCLFDCLRVCLCVCLFFFCLLACLFVCLFVCLCVCLLKFQRWDNCDLSDVQRCLTAALSTEGMSGGTQDSGC